MIQESGAATQGIVDVDTDPEDCRLRDSLQQFFTKAQCKREGDSVRVAFSESYPSEPSTLACRGELVFQMIGAVAQFERSLIGERVRSGLANAKAKGKVFRSR